MIKFKLDTKRHAPPVRAGGGNHNAPIVVLDSGLGGLTVARAIRQELPHEHVVYFGDTARLPYGSKTGTAVSQFVRQIIGYLRPLNPKHVVLACNTATALGLTAAAEAFPDLTISGVIDPGARAAVSQFVRQIIGYLRPLNPKHVVLACNTATALGLTAAAEAFPDLTISGVIDPGARAAVVAAGAKRQPVIGVLATEATVRSAAYERAILRRRQHARLLLRPAPLLAPIVEEGRTSDDPLVRLALEQYVGPMVERGMDVLVLGCTHYPILRPAIERVAGPGVRVIDSAQQCAQDVARRLRRHGLLRAPVGKPGAPGIGGGIRCYVTDDPARFALLAGRFLGQPIEPPTLVEPDALYRQETVRQRLRTAG